MGDVSASVYAKRGWYKNKIMFMPNSKLYAYKVLAKLSIPIEIC
jgi:hypothetical protein